LEKRGLVLKHSVTIGRLVAGRARRRSKRRVPRDVSLLGLLGAELQRGGVKAEPGPDEAALLVYQAGESLPVWVFVGWGGTYFGWESGHKHHPVTDVVGAADALAAYVGRGPR
jgi:hypothetical protein